MSSGVWKEFCQGILSIFDVHFKKTFKHLKKAYGDEREELENHVKITWNVVLWGTERAALA